MPQRNNPGKSSPALAIFAVAFAARAIFLAQSLRSPYFGAPFLDEQYYYEWAIRISHGQIISLHAFFRAPLYAYLLGGLFALFGPNFFLPKLLQHLLGSVACVLVFKIADRCFDRPTAWLAGLMAALYPPMIFFEGEMLDISLQLFFYPALVLIGAYSLRDPRWRWTILFGITAGAAAIARPNILLTVACWIALQIVLSVRRGAWKDGLARSGAIAGLIALWTIPPLLHNIHADGSWVPISTYAGVNFYIGNGPSADGYTASTPTRHESFGAYEDSVELFARRRAERLLGRPPSGAEIDRFWLRLTASRIAGRPARFVRLLLKKIALFWNGYEIRNNKDIYFALKFTPALDLLHRLWNFRLLAPLGLLGIALVALGTPKRTHRRDAESTEESSSQRPLRLGGELISLTSSRGRSVENLWLTVAVAAHMVSVVLFFVCDRYRLPVAPLLIVLVAAGLRLTWDLARQGHLRSVALVGAALVALAALTNIPWFDMSPRVPHRDIWNVANCFKAKGQLDDALQWYEQFLGLNPNFADGWNNMGEALVRKGRVGDAIGCFERAAQLDSRWSVPLNNMGYCRLKMGDAEDSLSAYDKALELAPDNRLARSGRAEALAALGRDSEALAELDPLLAKDPDFVAALWAKAIILARRNQPDEARDLARRAIEHASPATATEILADPVIGKLLTKSSPNK